MPLRCGEVDDSLKYSWLGFTWAFKQLLSVPVESFIKHFSAVFLLDRPSSKISPNMPFEAFSACLGGFLSRALFDGVCGPTMFLTPANTSFFEGAQATPSYDKPIICTFVNYLRPLLIIDAAHLKGQYKGTNLLAVGMDGNNQIMPVAFGICKEETGPCWSWWMFVLKECIGDNPNLLFISDRQSCLALSSIWKICKAYTPEEFTSNINILQAIQPDAYNKLCDAGPQRWSRAHCLLIRYNYMTSNSVESVNACTVLKRKLPITMLAETYQAMVQDWYFKH
ncbi:transposase, MuDR, MULE transposase domain protein [Tanacetum coccineum]|uniref:Transposase, MuDR, MULE transposase domain protein n=1 Tax=Tanacetum coccineum TaxID=301880 RepID=A0ABQ5D8C3_9ASTR